MVDTADPVSKLRDLRDSIDNIDAAIVHMLAERFRYTHAVGKLKARHGLPSRDPGREACGVSQRSASSTRILRRSSSPLLFVKSFDITNRFDAQPPKVFRDELRKTPGSPL